MKKKRGEIPYKEAFLEKELHGLEKSLFFSYLNRCNRLYNFLVTFEIHFLNEVQIFIRRSLMYYASRGFRFLSSPKNKIVRSLGFGDTNNHSLL